MDKQNAIEVRNVNKDFKIEYDKAKTLKERLVFLVEAIQSITMF